MESGKRLSIWIERLRLMKESIIVIPRRIRSSSGRVRQYPALRESKLKSPPSRVEVYLACCIVLRQFCGYRLRI